MPIAGSDRITLLLIKINSVIVRHRIHTKWTLRDYIITLLYSKVSQLTEVAKLSQYKLAQSNARNPAQLVNIIADTQ